MIFPTGVSSFHQKAKELPMMTRLIEWAIYSRHNFDPWLIDWLIPLPTRPPPHLPEPVWCGLIRSATKNRQSAYPFHADTGVFAILFSFFLDLAYRSHAAFDSLFVLFCSFRYQIDIFFSFLFYLLTGLFWDATRQPCSLVWCDWIGLDWDSCCAHDDS